MIWYFKPLIVSFVNPSSNLIVPSKAAAADVFAKEVGEKKATVEEESAKVRLFVRDSNHELFLP